MVAIVRWLRWGRSAGTRSRCVAPGVAALLVVGGCGGSVGSTDDTRDRGSPEIDPSSPESLADSLGCDDVTDLHSMLAPIRGNAATRGLSCRVDGERIHIFARAPIEDASAEGWLQGGTVENIRRLLGADAVEPGCELAVLISDDVFVVGSTTDRLADLGVPGEEPIPASPTVSYLEDCTIR